jgi:3-hydroxyisobutyrate dehydrogenase-like beta-hydroxyacid dehydrogenase
MSESQEVALTVAVIGAGEMGSAVGRRMREMGARVLTELRDRGADSAERVRRAGLEVVADDDGLVSGVDFVLSIVPPGVAVEVAERLRGPLERAQTKPIFVECNAVSPLTVRKIENILAATGCGFIDAGIIGGPPPEGAENAAKGPRFYASGPLAFMLTQLSVYGLDIALLDGPVGAASGLKLSYAGLTKGLTALAAAMVGGAARHGLAEALLSELARSQPDLLKRCERFLPTMPAKAYRWVAEMEQIAEFLGEEGDGATIYTGAARLFEQLAAELEEGVTGGRLSALAAFCSGAKALDKRR